MPDPSGVEVHVRSVRASPRSVWTFAMVVDADGRAGFGETAGGDTVRVESIARRYGASWVGSCSDREVRWNPATADGDERRARSLIAQALADLAARQAERSLAELLGVPKRMTVPVYANLNRGLAIRSPDAFAMRALEARSDGYAAVKIAPFDEVSRDGCAGRDAAARTSAGIARVEAVRGAIGSHVDILVDCHWRFDERGASHAIDALARDGVTWVECPLPETIGAIDAIRRLRGAANAKGIRLAGGDEIDDIDVFRTFVESDAYDVVMPDVKYLGGPREAMQLAAFALARGTAVSFHNPSGPVAHAHSVQLSALLEGDLPLEVQYREGVDTCEWLDKDANCVANGCVILPTGAGIGTALSQRWMKDANLAMCMPHKEPT